MTVSEYWKVYLLECSDGSLYCGAAKDVPGRIERHNAGKGAKYTRSRLPVRLAAESFEMPKNQALRLECYIKKQPAVDKIRKLRNYRPGHDLNPAH